MNELSFVHECKFQLQEFLSLFLKETWLSINELKIFYFLFLVFKELKVVLQTVPEIGEVVGNAYVEQLINLNEQDGAENAKLTLRLFFTKLMSSSKDVISKVISKLISRLNKKNEVTQTLLSSLLYLILHAQDSIWDTFFGWGDYKTDPFSADPPTHPLLPKSWILHGLDYFLFVHCLT